MVRNLSRKLLVSVGACLVFGATAVSAAPVFYVNNPSGNSVDWTNGVLGLGGSINSNVNFDTHPLGALNGAFYQVSDGVTLSLTGAWGGIVNTNSSQGNISGQQPGEGVHPLSNNLFGNAGAKTLTISFAGPVLGVLLNTIDYFDTNPNDLMSITAFDGVNGTGSVIGSATSVNQNFQSSRQYFMGVSDASNTIRSLVFSYSGAVTGDTIGIDDIRFATLAVNVPDPATLGLLGTGLVLMGLRAGRRGARAA